MEEFNVLYSKVDVISIIFSNHLLFYVRLNIQFFLLPINLMNSRFSRPPPRRVRLCLLPNTELSSQLPTFALTTYVLQTSRHIMVIIITSVVVNYVSLFQIN
jgi:hypothetical protein